MKIKDIQKLKLICKTCESELSINLGQYAFTCSVCNNAFTNDPQNSFYQNLYKALNELKNHPSVDFEFIGKEQ